MTKEQEEAERKFIILGHKPENKDCDHRQYIPMEHGRYCLCGTIMWDAGD